MDGTFWKSPKADERGQYQRDNGTKGSERPNLTGQAKGWASPIVQTTKPGQGTRERERRANGVDLPTAIAESARPTPRHRDGKGQGHADCLPNVVAVNESLYCDLCTQPKSAETTWSTCPHCHQNSFSLTRKELETHLLGKRAGRSSGRDSSPDLEKNSTDGNHQGSSQLSADWVEALMDVPPMWTDCDCLETGFTQRRQ